MHIGQIISIKLLIMFGLKFYNTHIFILILKTLQRQKIFIFMFLSSFDNKIKIHHIS